MVTSLPRANQSCMPDYLKACGADIGHGRFFSNCLTIWFSRCRIPRNNPARRKPTFSTGGKEMIVPAVRTLLLAALLAVPSMAANHATRDVPTQHNEATVAQLQAEMASGQ